MVGDGEWRAVVVDEPERFAARAGGFLSARPAEHSVLLTRLARALAGERSSGPDGDLWAWVERPEGTDGPGAVVGALMHTPPHGAYLSRAPQPAVTELATALHARRPGLPGVGGPGATAVAFAATWRELGGPAACLAMRQGLYVADRVAAPQGVPGRHRLATPADLETLRPWGFAFTEETGAAGGGPDLDHVTWRIVEGLLHVWDVDGEPVSMAAVTAPQSGVSRVQLVYTPKALRGKGYAAACVAAVTAAELANPGRTCMLYTDLANPTSNALYERLGYRRVGDALDLYFESAVS